MKNIDLKKTLVLFAFLAALLVSLPTSLYADGDDGEEGDPIDLTFEQQNGVPIGRSLGCLPMEAFYNAETGNLIVSFVQNVGNVTVVLTNMTTGAIASTVVDSSIGNCVLPVTGGSGLYRLDFLLSDGTRFYGYFHIQ